MSTSGLDHPLFGAGVLEYYARITKQRDGGYIVEFPDLPGCFTEGETMKETLANAKEALSGWLYVALKHGDEVVPPKEYRGRSYKRVTPDLDIAVPLLILWARKHRGFTQEQVSEALGISQQAYRKYEIPGKSNPTIKTLTRLSSVLGFQLTLWSAYSPQT